MLYQYNPSQWVIERFTANTIPNDLTKDLRWALIKSYDFLFKQIVVLQDIKTDVGFHLNALAIEFDQQNNKWMPTVIICKEKAWDSVVEKIPTLLKWIIENIKKVAEKQKIVAEWRTISIEAIDWNYLDFSIFAPWYTKFEMDLMELITNIVNVNYYIVKSNLTSLAISIEPLNMTEQELEENQVPIISTPQIKNTKTTKQVEKNTQTNKQVIEAYQAPENNTLSSEEVNLENQLNDNTVDIQDLDI